MNPLVTRLRDTAPHGIEALLQPLDPGEDDRALERADEETQMTAPERDVDREDYEERKDDIKTDASYAGFDAAEVAQNEVDDDPAY